MPFLISSQRTDEAFRKRSLAGLAGSRQSVAGRMTVDHSTRSFAEFHFRSTCDAKPLALSVVIVCNVLLSDWLRNGVFTFPVATDRLRVDWGLGC